MPAIPALRTTEHLARTYRHTWRGSITVTFLNPVLYLAAMGVGLGSFVDHARGSTGGLDHVTYLRFVGPALLAVTAMQTAGTESTYSIMGAIKWDRSYAAMLATPLRVADVYLGHLIWICIRIVTATTVYLGVLAAFGAAPSWESLAALPAAVLTGLAFATPIMAYAASQDDEAGFNLIFRFILIPLFLFSGTFFPVAQLPVALRALAYATPLWHGTDLCRSLVLGTATFPEVTVHLAYLGILAGAGIAAGLSVYRRRLYR